MTEKKLKYKQYLDKFPNCPSLDFSEVEMDAYRWTNFPLSANDFTPVNLIKEPPARMLDNSDNMCIAYGLSLFDTRCNSLTKYQRLYNKQRNHQKELFRQDKGCYIALIKLTKEEGIANSPNESGHFTFHEYSETRLDEKITTFYNIFTDNGEFNFQ